MAISRRKFMIGAAAISQMISGKLMAEEDFDAILGAQKDSLMDDSIINNRILVRNESNQPPSVNGLKKLDSIKKYAGFYSGQTYAQTVLRHELKKKYKLGNNIEVYLYPGARQGISQIVSNKMFKNIVVSDPDYQEAKLSGYLYNKKVILMKTTRAKVDLNGLDKKLKSLKKALVYFSNPQLPFGTHLNKLDILNMVKRNKDNYFLIDEAYIHFLGDDYLEKSLIKHLNEHPNLMVIQTFSKAYCAAGLRCGVLFLDNKLFKKLMPDENLFNPHISLFSLAYCTGALLDEEYLKLVIQNNFKIKEYFLEKMKKFTNFKVIDSYTNFGTIILDKRYDSDLVEKIFYPYLINYSKNGYIRVSFKSMKSIDVFCDRLTNLIKVS